MPPMMPMVRPDLAMSEVEMIPVDEAMALGGVEIGKVMANEAAIAVTKRRARIPPTATRVSPIPIPTAQRIGIMRAAVAELEIKLLRVQQTRPAAMRTTIGDQLPNGMEVTMSLAKPDLLKPRPRAKPPATIQRTDQLIFSRSFLLNIPVTLSSMIGTRATTLALT